MFVNVDLFICLPSLSLSICDFHCAIFRVRELGLHFIRPIWAFAFFLDAVCVCVCVCVLMSICIIVELLCIYCVSLHINSKLNLMTQPLN